MIVDGASSCEKCRPDPLTLASVLLCLATAAIWVGSYFMGGSFGYEWSNGAVQVRSTDGRFQLSRCHHWGAPAGTRIVWNRDDLMETDAPQMIPPRVMLAPVSLANGWGFGFGSIEVSSPASGVVTNALAAPYWVVMLCFLTPYGYRLLLRRRLASRIRDCLCTVCSYDIRATPEGCPECGATTPTTS